MEIDRDVLKTGIPLIDEQHDRYIDMVEDFFDHSSGPEFESEVLEKCINEILNYAGEHFDAEEFLMRSSNYSFLDEHVDKHNIFREKADSLLLSMDRRLDDVTALLADLHRWLIEWFIFQVQNDDLKLAEFLRRKEEVK